MVCDSPRRPGRHVEVVTLFALFHDSRRRNEATTSGTVFEGRSMPGRYVDRLIHLDDRNFELLYEACRLHTDGLTEGDITLQTCWDADRLDLGRVGITPSPHLLCSDAARELIDWADRRAISEYEPEFVANDWGLSRDALRPIAPTDRSAGRQFASETGSPRCLPSADRAD